MLSKMCSVTAEMDPGLQLARLVDRASQIEADLTEAKATLMVRMRCIAQRLPEGDPDRAALVASADELEVSIRGRHRHTVGSV